MDFPFSPYISFLEQCLARRRDIVDALARELFGARGKTAARNARRESIEGIFATCFFESPAAGQQPVSLKGQLDAAHLADGFEPAREDGYARGLDPVELVLRACHHWETTRWPGANGRRAYAESLYAAFMLRQLERLSLRIWDQGHDPAPARLHQVQRLLDLLNSPQEIRLVRDARWLIQTAQGPLTKHVRPYFNTAANVSELSDDVRLEIHRAGAALAGGHLRSQLRHLSWRTGWAFGDPQLLALTRSSNSMDLGLLVRDLIPLLDAYSAACVRQDSRVRLALADAILQGLSADPELLLIRLDLLGPSTMFEDLFIDRDEAGAASYTALGSAHRASLALYGDLAGRTAQSLLEDSRTFDPGQAPYSPLGLVYGFCADLFSNMVLSTMRSSPSRDVSLEDLFNSRERLDDKQARAHEWQGLPTASGDRRPFEHSPEWAALMHARLVRALDARAARPAEPNASAFRTSYLHVVPRGVSIDAIPDGALPAGIVSAQEHCLTSDVTRARSTGATALTADRLSADRAEGRLLACADADGAWFGVSKIPLTLFTGQGKDALITDVPPAVIEQLRRVCPVFLAVIGQG